jgi:hypothetical protein
MTFRDGGAFDYHTIFEQIKERLYNALSIAREEGRNIGSVGILGGADLASVHLEQLPAYEPPPQALNVSSAEVQDLIPPEEPTARDSGIAGLRGSNQSKPEEDLSTSPMEPPNEPPPGYEEAQAQAVTMNLDQRLREEAEFADDDSET